MNKDNQDRIVTYYLEIMGIIFLSSSHYIFRESYLFGTVFLVLGIIFWVGARLRKERTNEQ